MNRWPIWILVCLALCGCQIAGGPASLRSDDPCPSPNPCDGPGGDGPGGADPDGDDPGEDARLLPLGPVPGRVATQAAWRPPIPGCPTTLQVMARPHRIAFQAVRPNEEPDTAPELFDLVCDPPEEPLLRARLWPPDRRLADRRPG